jgi:hypothetical protein
MFPPATLGTLPRGRVDPIHGHLCQSSFMKAVGRASDHKRCIPRPLQMRLARAIAIENRHERCDIRHARQMTSHWTPTPAEFDRGALYISERLFRVWMRRGWIDRLGRGLCHMIYEICGDDAGLLFEYRVSEACRLTNATLSVALHVVYRSVRQGHVPRIPVLVRRILRYVHRG